MRAPISLCLTMSSFDFPGVGADRLFDKLVEIATTAEDAGFDAIALVDHFHQIPYVGPPTMRMLHGNSLFAGLAARTSKVALGLLVGGVTYRNPAMHAKITTTADIISGGRAWHGLGAAYFEAEHRAYGFAFPPLRERFERLEEAVQIARAMFTQDRSTFDGMHYRVDEALNNPRPLRGDIPIVIAGSGERKTLRLVARYADGSNIFGDVAEARRLMGVLERHCEEVGRDPAEITKTRMGFLVIGETHEAATAKLGGLELSAERQRNAMVGDPDSIAEQAAAFREAGIEGLTLTMPDAYDLEAVALAGRALAPVFMTQPA